MATSLRKTNESFFKFVQAQIPVFFLVLFASCPVWCASFAKGFGSLAGADVVIKSNVVDASSNVYLAGSFGSLTLVLGGVTLTRIGGQDAFVAKLDSSGTVVWAKNFGGATANVEAKSLALDSSGNLYLSGEVSGNLTTPALTYIGNTDAFAFKLDSSGVPVWAKNFGGAGAAAHGNSIAVDSSGNVYIGGAFGSAALTTPALTALGWQDAFAMKLTSAGATTWAKNYGGSGAYTEVLSLTVDSTGNVYLGGKLGGSDLTTPALTRIGAIDALAMKLNSSGTTTWAKNYGGGGVGGVFAQFNSLTVDSSNNVYLGGYFEQTNMSTPALTRIGNRDALVMKLSSAGVTTWAKNFGGSSGAKATSNGIAVDSSGNVYLGGYFEIMNLTTPALSRIGSQDATVFKLNSSGTTTWSKNFGGLRAGGLSVSKIATDSAGNIYLAGDSESLLMYFGGVTLNLIGAHDVFVVKLDSSGNVLWAKNFGGAGALILGPSVAVDSSGNVYLGGSFGYGSLTTPALTLMGDSDAFVIKLNSSGTTTWAKNFGGVGAEASRVSVAVDSSSNVYLGGSFAYANLTTPALTLIGDSDAFVLKLNSSGTTTWAKNFGGVGAGVDGNAITVDSSSNVYLAGTFRYANLTNPALTVIGTYDTFVLKLDSSGTTTLAKNFGGAGAYASCFRVAVDSSGNIYLGGELYYANLTTPTLNLIGDSDGFVLKLNSSGVVTWAKNFGGTGVYLDLMGLAVDSSGNVYVGGDWYSGNLTTPALSLIGGRDVFALKLNSSGVITWAQNFGGPGSYVSVGSVTIDSNGSVYLGGTFDVDFTVPSLTLTQAGGYDAFIIRVQIFDTPCTETGKIKYDVPNTVMVFCDGSFWQSMNNNTAATCTGTTAGKFQYYSNGAGSDFVWYGDSCRSAKSTTTYGACAVNGKIEWNLTNSTVRGCINGTWTSLKGW